MKLCIASSKLYLVTWTRDENLQTWAQVQQQVLGEWSLLLGNGFSRNISGEFAYDTLQAVAGRAPRNGNDIRLSAQAQQMFTDLATTNFEEVLRHLHSARTVAQALGNHTFDMSVETVEQNVRNSLASAVRDVHVKHRDLQRHLGAIRAELRNYRQVFTTNYDLIPYWAVMENGNPNGFVDFFWGAGNSFDSSRTEVFNGGNTPIYYMHGALHLFEAGTGRIEKLTNVSYDVLLDQCLNQIETKRSPHFISEGTFLKKKAEIRRSDYLDFCFRSFGSLSRPLVVLGHSLDLTCDNHLIEAMCGPDFTAPHVAISIFPNPRVSNLAVKHGFAARLPGKDLSFFDSRTHPLGNPNLAV